jgi:hypothetical protein
MTDSRQSGSPMVGGRDVNWRPEPVGRRELRLLRRDGPFRYSRTLWHYWRFKRSVRKIEPDDD